MHYIRVQILRVKNITLSAEATLIQRARKKAEDEKSSLNRRFREWLTQYVGRKDIEEEYMTLMQDLQYVEPGRSFTRDEMNER